METIGSQKRELLAESGMTLVSSDNDTAVLQADDDGNLEMWYANDKHAGYVIVIDGIGFEFIRSIS